VFQLAYGEYKATYITPTFNPWRDVILEWHEDCLPRSLLLVLLEQEQPYHCMICAAKVSDAEQVTYFTRGSKPSPPYKRLEARGYSLPMIAHIECWARALGRDPK